MRNTTLILFLLLSLIGKTQVKSLTLDNIPKGIYFQESFDFNDDGFVLLLGNDPLLSVVNSPKILYGLDTALNLKWKTIIEPWKKNPDFSEYFIVNEEQDIVILQVMAELGRSAVYATHVNKEGDFKSWEVEALSFNAFQDVNFAFVDDGKLHLVDLEKGVGPKMTIYQVDIWNNTFQTLEHTLPTKPEDEFHSYWNVVRAREGKILFSYIRHEENQSNYSLHDLDIEKGTWSELSFELELPKSVYLYPSFEDDFSQSSLDHKLIYVSYSRKGMSKAGPAAFSFLQTFPEDDNYYVSALYGTAPFKKDKGLYSGILIQKYTNKGELEWSTKKKFKSSAPDLAKLEFEERYKGLLKTDERLYAQCWWYYTFFSVLLNEKGEIMDNKWDGTDVKERYDRLNLETSCRHVQTMEGFHRYMRKYLEDVPSSWINTFLWNSNGGVFIENHLKKGYLELQKFNLKKESSN
ncbi:MAG: hypothetical protein AAF487_04580 [Bacteroidota bacterium]